MSKGYQEANIAASEALSEPISSPPVVDPDARARAILDRLTAAVNNPRAVAQPKQWQLDRVIWRSGELQLTAAAPLLMQLWGDNALRNYSIAWALGNCGDEAAISLLEQVYRNSTNLEHVRRIALEAIFKLSSVKRDALRAELISQLPSQLHELIQSGAATELIIDALQTDLDHAKPVGAASQNENRFEILDILYQIDNESTRSVMLKVVRYAPLEPNYFKRLRHIFKIAEYRQDAEIFGILAYRFEQTPEFYKSNSYWIYIPNGGGYLKLQNWEYDQQAGHYQYSKTNEFKTEMARSDGRLAYSSKTRDYLRRRVWRSLKTLGESNRSDFCQTLSIDILIQLLAKPYEVTAQLGFELA